MQIYWLFKYSVLYIFMLPLCFFNLSDLIKSILQIYISMGVQRCRSGFNPHIALEISWERGLLMAFDVQPVQGYDTL